MVLNIYNIYNVYWDTKWDKKGYPYEYLSIGPMVLNIYNIYWDKKRDKTGYH